MDDEGKVRRRDVGGWSGEPDGWADNERTRLSIGVDASPAERLTWLEEAIRLAYRTGALPRPPAAGRRTPRG